MKLNKILMFVLIIILVSISIIATNHDTSTPNPVIDQNTFNPDNPNNFNYAQGDYATITDWKNVDFDKIDYNNPSLNLNNIPSEYAEKVDSAKAILSGKGKQLTAEQISYDLEKIGDLVNDVDEAKAREAIKSKTGVMVVSLGKEAKIENGILKSKEGSFQLEGKKEWEITVDENGVIQVLKPATINEKTVTKQDSFTLTKDIDYKTKRGETYTVQQLSFKNGQAFVKPGTTAQVGYYNIVAGKEPINIYLDSTKKSSGNYVSISNNHLDIKSTTDNTVKVIPQPGNKLFNMVQRDYSTKPPKLVPSEKDTMEITVTNGDSLKVESRASSGKTPLVKHNHDGGNVKIETGRLDIAVGKELNVKLPQNLFNYEGVIDDRNSVAFELVSKGNLEDVFRTSSSNRFEHLIEGEPVLKRSQGLEVSDSIDVNMMKTTADLQAKFPGIKFNKPDIDERNYNFNYREITANMAQGWDQWLREKPGIEKYVKNVYFDTRKNAGAGFGRITAGERTMDSATRNDKPGRGHNVLQTLDHEFVHVVDIYVSDKYSSDVNSISKDKLPPKLSDLYNQELLKIGRELSEDPEFKRLQQDVNSFKGSRKVNFAKLELGEKKALSYNLHYLGNGLKKRKGAEEYGQRYENLIKRKTGLYPYSFTYGFKNFPEVSATYSELPPEQARRHPNLAQLEYDRVMNVNPPTWMEEKARKRYESILPPDGEYCQKNPCGPCILYKTNCKK